MNKPKNYLIAIAVIASLAAIMSLMKRGKSYPSIAFFFENDYVTMEDTVNHKHTKFWDNYPNWVTSSEYEKLTDSFVSRLKPLNKYSDTHILLKKKAHSFYLLYKQDTAHRFFAKQLKDYIKDSCSDIAIIVEKKSAGILDSSFLERPNVFVTSDPIPLPISVIKVPFFFKLTNNNNVYDIYVPRIEIPEVSIKYLQFKDFTIK
jgi:hypothetical protein